MICKSLPKTFKGGIQTHVWELSAELLKLGIEVSILTGGSLRKGRVTHQTEGIQIIEIPYLRGKVIPFLSVTLEEFSFNLAAANWLKRFQGNYDIIHLQGRSGYLFPYLGLKSPVVQTVHRLLKVENQWATKAYNNWFDKWLHETLTFFFERKAVKAADRVVGVSQSTIAETSKICQLDESSIKLIYNGAHLEDTPISHLPPKKQLLFVGRLSAIKGVFPLLKAMQRLPNHIKLVMIGEGPAKNKLEVMIKALNIQDQVQLIGSKEQHEVRALIKESFALILPSFHESQGIVLMEANAAGRPVLAAQSSGVMEVVEHQKNGLLFPAGIPEAIEKSVLELFKDPKKASQMGRYGYHLVQKYFTWEHIAKQTLQLYREL